MAEEVEVEEGEICQDYCADIDMKIERYLSEYRKEFEGIVSFENLGPRFGMYGSFLPCYQRPPSLLFHPTIQSVPSASQFSSQQSNSVELNHEVTTSSVGGPVSVRKKAVKRVASHRDEPPVSPFIIQGDWICCGHCRKWRLLPYGTKREQLSDSWLCSMLDWLPGMDHCDVSEEDTTRGLHAIYQLLILNNFQNRDGKGSIAHNGREISVKKRKLKDQDCLVTSRCNGNGLGDGDINAVDREVSGGFRKLKISKRESSTSKGKETSRTRDRVARIILGIEDSPPIDRSAADREHQTKKYRVGHQSQEEFGMIRKQVCKFPRKQTLGLGYGKEVRTCIAI
ncbi:hypothetical protein BC332_21316 [Capsicum chinense]|nr:hypothetical protein BC332_21316 [Capsicum chinense]